MKKPASCESLAGEGTQSTGLVALDAGENSQDHGEYQADAQGD